MSNTIDPIYHETHEKVLAVNRKFRLIHVGAALLQFVFLAICVFLGFLFIEVLFDLIPPLRLLFWALLAGGLGYFLIKEIVPNLRRAFSPAEQDLYQISRLIGDETPQVQDALVNFLQIYRDEGIATHAAFKNLSLKQLYNTFCDVDFGKILNLAGWKRPGIRLLAAMGGFAFMFLLFPGATNQAFLKILHPTQSFEPPFPVTLKSISGEQVVLKNDPVTLEGEFTGVMPSRLWLVLENFADDSKSPELERLEVPLRSGNRFEYELKHVKNRFNYWFEAQLDMRGFENRPAKSDMNAVLVKERPFIRELQVKLAYPVYTRLPEKFLPLNDGEVTALKGTTVDIRIEANKSLTGSWFQFDDSTRIELQTNGNRATGQFTVREDGQYHVGIRDADGIENYQPVQYAVFALQDELPFVEITRPGQDLELGEELDLPLLINLRDDYGFTKLSLKGRHIKAGSTGDTSEFAIDVPYQRIEATRALADYRWNLRNFYLSPDDFVEYFAEIRDNDVITGPKTARSQTYVLRLPSLMEVLAKADENLSEQLEDTREIAEETKALKEKLEEINREMKREEELTWERKQQIQEQAQKQQENLDKMQELREELEQVISDLEQRDVLSQETLEKYMELQQMIEDLASPEMLEALKELQKAMENANMEEIKEAMERFEFSVEQFEERIERTYELFKRVQLEQKMDELNKMAQEMLDAQKQINEQLQQENLSKDKQEQLAQQEENLAENSEAMEDALEKATSEFEEMMPEIAESLEKTREFMDEQQISEQMQQMQQQMQQGQQQNAQKSGENVQKQLEMLQSRMQQNRQQMQQQQQQELMQAMQKVQQDLLRSSFQQEKLVERSQNSDMASNSINQTAREQAQLRENAGNIVRQMLEISNKSFFMQPGMSQIMQSLMGNMENALQGLSNRNPRGAARSQQKALGNYNEAIMSMQSSMNSMMQSQSGTGFEQFMQQMQQMAGQQGQLNQESMSMFQQGQRPGGQVPAEQMARMAAQQQAIQKSLEKLNDEMGNRNDVLGRLGELGEEMEKVVEELQRLQLSPKVIERQQRILSRMLDAQKSVREKEHSKKRQAEREQGVAAKSPPQLKREMLERENQLRKEMQEALKEGYSSEYKEYIKLYYEILSRQGETAGEKK
ncbi:MAG: DUF4175 family protein [Calditrichia bacterium]